MSEKLPKHMHRRPDSPFIWLAFYDAAGTRQRVSSGTDDAEKAKKVLATIKREVRAQKESGLSLDGGAITVRAYAAKWIQGRKDRGVDSADDDETRLGHALGAEVAGLPFGSMPLKEVRTRHLRDLVRALEVKVLTRIRHGAKEEYRLAPRSILHIYGVLRVMFRDAFVDELIPASPAVLEERRRELPAKVDKDPEWRDGAVYTREEVEALISDERIPERQRVLYGLEFLCGVRINEVTPRRWRDYDATVQPLGKLLFATAWSRKHKRVKRTKTKVERPVPVHPTLAKLLARWKLSGWERVYGRAPGPDDLIIPAVPHPRGRHAERTASQYNRRPEDAAAAFLESSTELGRMHEALELLGLRKRGQHDARATFMTLSVADGGNPLVLEPVTHAKEKDVRAGYHRFPWAVTCAEVAKLRIQLREGSLLRLAP